MSITTVGSWALVLYWLTVAHIPGCVITSTVPSNGSVVQSETIWSIHWQEWLAALLSITLISTVGLLGVAAVPLVQHAYYNHVIQFFVALAVGTLTGDAMLHLLPHAIVASVQHSVPEIMADPEQMKTNERNTVYKGLVALAGVYLFYLAEKLLSLIAEYRAEKNSQKSLDRHQRHASISQGSPPTVEQNQIIFPDPDSVFRLQPPELGRNCSDIPGSRRVQSLSSELIRPFSPRSISDDIIESQVSRSRHRKGSLLFTKSLSSVSPADEIFAIGLGSKAMKSIDSYIRKVEGNASSQVDYSNSISQNAPSSSVRASARCYRKTEDVCSPEEDLPFLDPPSDIVDCHETKINDKDSHRDTNNVVVDRLHSGHTGHSHKHGTQIPDSIASVAWMVILGDCLHNFTDGMAIGAAFAQGVSGGLSTSVAVLCHELPHELGDFAVLIKTGMHVREALVYNILSSFVSLVGMVIGLALGNVDSISYWIFAVAGGTFIYISLVDMLPELNMANVKQGESRIAHFVIQTAGLSCGVFLMLLIAFYEDELKAMLD